MICDYGVMKGPAASLVSFLFADWRRGTLYFLRNFPSLEKPTTTTDVKQLTPLRTVSSQ
jgi:hypothetical protein